MALHVFLLLVTLILNYYRIEGSEITKHENSKIASIEPMLVADEFDCIDMYKQHAFSHPALKDHKIKLEPSFIGRLKLREVSSSIKAMRLNFERPGCPPGMVPIQKKMIQGGNDSFHGFTKTYPGQHFAVVRNKQHLVAHGAGGIMNTGDLQLRDLQVSAAQIWVQNGPISELNSIQAGWEINPALYGDSYTHLTAFWTVDNYAKTGCYNTLCPGFLQVLSKPVLGARMHNSEYGKQQYIVDIMIRQDETSGDWWLVVDNFPVGYWPKELFNHLREEATFIQYGGWTGNVPTSESPPMGSGHFANNQMNESAFILQMKRVNRGYSEGPIDFYVMETYTDDSACYNVSYNGYGNQTTGHVMFYGGPGGSCTV